MKKLLKIICWSLATIVLLFASYQALNVLTTQFRQRQRTGDLHFSQSLSSKHRFTIANFVIHWSPTDGGSLCLSHISDSTKVLWETLPGIGFVGAGRGVEHVAESRGSFEINDEIQAIWTKQYLSSIISNDSAIILSGTLSRSKADTIDYTLVFRVLSGNRLQFILQIKDSLVNRSYLTYSSEKEEHFFGFGEQFTYFDLKGKRVPIFIMEQGIGRGKQPMTWLLNFFVGVGGNSRTSYACVPHYISSKMRSFFLKILNILCLTYANQIVFNAWFFQTQSPEISSREDRPSNLSVSILNLVVGCAPCLSWCNKGAIIGLQGGIQKKFGLSGSS